MWTFPITRIRQWATSAMDIGPPLLPGTVMYSTRAPIQPARQGYERFSWSELMTTRPPRQVRARYPPVGQLKSVACSAMDGGSAPGAFWREMATARFSLHLTEAPKL